MNPVFSVTELNRAVNDRLSQDPVLGKVRVRGEVSGLKTYPSGHSYFTLKDDTASVSCVLFRQPASQSSVKLAEGMQVLLFARTNLFDKNGRFQLIVDGVQEEGLGDLYRRFLDLKARLQEQGLFDQERKLPLPFIPDRIVAITSEAGAVIRDIIHVLRRRFPGIRLILIPVPVQGAGAEHEIAAAIQLANQLSLGDVIIVGRGGGSLEDLQPFNEEVTALAIAASRIPVISAVGHETDYTIADFAADLRAPTPSAAAELAVPVKDDLLLRAEQLGAACELAMVRRLELAGSRLSALVTRPVLVRPTAFLDGHQARIQFFSHRLISAWKEAQIQAQRRVEDRGAAMEAALVKVFSDRTLALARTAQTLEALSPLAVLSRGYSLVTDPEGRSISRARNLAKGDALELVFQDGRVGGQVTRPLAHADSQEEGKTNG